MVTSADPRATLVGQQILRRGGSAADAAMAMMLALGVVEPQSSGIGGGGFFVHHDATSGAMATVDGREAAPAAATAERFLGPAGNPLPFLDAFQGGRSVGVPGNLRLLAMVHARWGILPWKALFAPAIALAEQGYRVTPPMNTAMGYVARLWSRFPATAAQYGGGVPLAVGTLVRNPALAARLRMIADHGPEAFYRGANAHAIIDTVTTATNPSDMTLADLATYRAHERPPICGDYRGHKVCGMGPPSSGAITTLQILGMVERFDLAAMGPDSPVAWHVIGEAMRLAYADREKFLGDPAFVAVPVAGLLDPAYLASRSALISTQASLAHYDAGAPPGASPRTASAQGEVPGTTHFIAIDRRGDIAAMTSTIEGPFGSQLITGGYMLNNELTDFSFAPSVRGAPVANRVEPGKRPLSSMAPTIVYDGGHPVFTVGAAGGKTIIMQVTKALIAHLDWKMSAEDSIAEGLLYFDKDGLVIEADTPLAAIKPGLELLGHHVALAHLPLKANAAELTEAGWIGAADPRGVGTALRE